MDLVSQQEIDNFADFVASVFNNYGVDVEIIKPDPKWQYEYGYYDCHLSCRITHIDGISDDNIYDYLGCPCINGYCIRIDTCFLYYYKFDKQGNQYIIDRIDYYINHFKELLKSLEKVTDRLYEIEPELSTFNQNFMNKYSDKFPNLGMKIYFKPWAHGDIYREYEYPLLYDRDIDEQPYIQVDINAVGNELHEVFSYQQFIDGSIESELVKLLSKIYKRASRPRVKGDGAVLQILSEHGIDITECTYELHAEVYRRYNSEEKREYTEQFDCYGNYLAYFSMALHKEPTPSNVVEYFGTLGAFEDFVDENPSIEDIADYASTYWWGDGDDYIYYLDNVTRNTTLYESDKEE